MGAAGTSSWHVTRWLPGSMPIRISVGSSSARTQAGRCQPQTSCMLLCYLTEPAPLGVMLQATHIMVGPP